MALILGHFLIDRLLTALPEADLTNFEVNRLRQYQRIPAFLEKLESRISARTIQTRAKWGKPLSVNIRPRTD